MGKNLVRLIFQKAAKIKALSIFFENEKMKKKRKHCTHDFRNVSVSKVNISTSFNLKL